MEDLQILISALGPIFTAIGFWFVYQQITIATKNYQLSALAAERAAKQAVETQTWRKSEFLAKQAKDFSEDPIVARVITMLDWRFRLIDVGKGGTDYVLFVQDPATLSEVRNNKRLEEKYISSGRYVCIVSALRLDKSTDFTLREARTRDDFDWFLFRLGQFQQMIKAGLFTYAEAEVHLRYALDLTSGGTSQVSDNLVAVLKRYAIQYGFKEADDLLSRRMQKREGRGLRNSSPQTTS